MWIRHLQNERPKCYKLKTRIAYEDITYFILSACILSILGITVDQLIIRKGTTVHGSPLVRINLLVEFSSTTVTNANPSAQKPLGNEYAGLNFAQNSIFQV